MTEQERDALAALNAAYGQHEQRTEEEIGWAIKVAHAHAQGEMAGYAKGVKYGAHVARWTAAFFPGGN